MVFARWFHHKLHHLDTLSLSQKFVRTCTLFYADRRTREFCWPWLVLTLFNVLKLGIVLIMFLSRNWSIKFILFMLAVSALFLYCSYCLPTFSLIVLIKLHLKRYIESKCLCIMLSIPWTWRLRKGIWCKLRLLWLNRR